MLLAKQYHIAGHEQNTYIYAIEKNYFCSSRWIWSTTYVIDRFATFSSCKYSLLAFIRWPSPRKRIFSHTLTDHKLTINQNSHFSIKCETQCVYMMINSMSGQVMQDATYVCVFFIAPMHASPSSFMKNIYFFAWCIKAFNSSENLQCFSPSSSDSSSSSSSFLNQK